MKWTVVALLFFGLLAAVFAAILVNVIRTGGAGSGAAEAIYAVEDIPDMTVITAKHIIKKPIVSKDKLPVGYLSIPEQAIGRVLITKVVKDQVLTKSSFVTDGTPAQLAAVLEPGMRAVSVTLSKSSVTGGLLYPGCIVDVIGAFNLQTNKNKGQAMSKTILENIKVLAVENITIVSPKESKKPADDRSEIQKQTVTLEVNSEQAKTLQLSMQYGVISLALRNPRDTKPVDFDATMVLDNGKFKESSFAKQIARAKDPNAVIIGEFDPNAEQTQQPAAPSTWQVTIIRGSNVEQRDLEYNTNEN